MKKCSSILSRAMEAVNHSKNSAMEADTISKNGRSSSASLKGRKMVAIAICLASCVTMFAQDIIILKNGNDIQAVVQEIGTDDVKYKRFDNPNGPNYTLKKSEIFMIRYENGSKDVFDEIVTNVPTDKQVQTAILSYSSGVWQNGRKLNPGEVRMAMAGNNEALLQFNNGRSLYVVGQVIAWPNWILAGWGLGTLIGSGGEYGGIPLGLGVAGILIGELISFSGNNKIKSSVQLYNSKVNNSVSYQINFGLTQTGVGLSMRF